MKFLKDLFRKEEDINTYADFWAWFVQHEKDFYKVASSGGDFENDFFDKVSPKLERLKDGLFLLSGMFDDNTAELIITPDGNIKNFVFAEEIVAAAPEIPGWKFTALKRESEEPFGIRMKDVDVTNDNLHFYANDSWEMPDEIDIVCVHDARTDENADAVRHAVFLFLDNFLGELSFATAIDNLTIISKNDAENDLRHINELKPYLIKRQSEFVEKYEGSRLNTDDDAYTLMEGELANGNPLIAVFNTTLLMWDRKPSHPWIASVGFKFDGNEHGLPDENIYALLEKIEDDMLVELRDADGYLNIGRETANGERTVYFACKDFRKPSKVLYEISKQNSKEIEMDFEIYKDKYWQSFNHFIPTEGDDFTN